MEYDREDIDLGLFPLSEEPFDKELEAIDNLALIENGLLHMEFELQQRVPSYFRVAREAQLILYRTMIQALCGTDPDSVINAVKEEKDSLTYRLGREGWKSIKYGGPVVPLGRAWRYSDPKPCAAPEEPAPLPKRNEKQKEKMPWLMPFYTALARIQTEGFMSHLCFSKPASISDAEMRTLEWLYGEVRNAYEHFIPKLYAAPQADLRDAALVCLRITHELLFNSGNIAVWDEDQRTRLMGKLDNIIPLLQN